QPRGTFRRRPQFRQVRQPDLERQEPRLEGIGPGLALDRLDADAVAGLERPRPFPPEPEHMAKAPQRLPEVARDGADIAALAADHLELDGVRVGPGLQR